MNSQVLSVEHEDGVATLWLDRPEARNAMGPAFWSDLPVTMVELANDPDVRAVIIAAKGPHFTVGLDLKAMASLLTGPPPAAGEAPAGEAPAGDQPTAGTPRRSKAALAAHTRIEVGRMQGSINAVADCPKPVIAAIHGYCIGGGVDLIAACDIRVASEDAVFSVRETTIAIVADLGSLQRLPRIIGAGHVAELAYTGKDISAARAKEIGLVNDVLADSDAALKAAKSIAAEIAANSPLAVQGTKAVLQARDRSAIAEGLDYVAVWNSGFLQSDDLVEAMGAFMEKRTPKFTGN